AIVENPAESASGTKAIIRGICAIRSRAAGVRRTAEERVTLPRITANDTPPHVVAVLAFDGVVLGDLATPCEIFGRVRSPAGRRRYEIRICSLTPEVRSEHVTLRVPWRLGSLRRAQTLIVPGIDDVDRPLPEPL